MATALEKLRDRLADNPSDLDLARRFSAACVKKGDYALLREGLGSIVADADPGSAESLAAILADILAERAAKTSRTRDAAALYRRAYRLTTVSSPNRSASLLAEAWTRCPDVSDVHAATKLAGANRISDAPTFLANALLAIGEGSERLEALRELGRRSLATNEIEAAERYFLSLVELRPGDPAAADGLKTIASIRDNANRALADARERAKNASTSDAVLAFTNLGEAELASDNAEAAEAAFRSALDKGAAPEAEAAIESLLRAQDRRDDLVALWKSLLETADDDRRGVLRRRLYRLLDELERHDEAQQFLAVAAARPGAPASAQQVMARAQEVAAQSDWNNAALILEDGINGTDDKETKLALLHEQAELFESHLDDVDRAEHAYRRIRITDPRSLAALRFYRRWYRQREEPRRTYSNLTQLHDVLAAAELDDVSERVSVAREMASVANAELASYDKAVDAWRRVLVDEPDNAEVYESLAVLHADAARWHALVELLEHWLKATPADDVEARTGLLFRLIDVYQDPSKLPMPELVIQTYQRIVSLAPTDHRALDGLAGRLKASEKWSDLVGVLARKVEAVDSPEAQLALFGEIADLYLNRIQSESQAIPVLERILDLEPDNLDVVRRLRDVYERRHDSDHLYETYERELALLEGKERLDVLQELAKLATDPLFRPHDAIAWWREVLELDPKNAAATEALQDLHAEQEDWDGYVVMLESKLAEAKTRKQKVEVLLELGELVYSRLDDKERAQEIFTQIAELSPFNTTARAFLQKLYVTRRAWADLRELYAPREDWRGYVALLRDYAERIDDQFLASDIHVEIATASSELLNDEDATIRHLESALTATPERAEIAQMLVDRFRRGVSARRRLPALESLARFGDDPERRMTAWRELAELHEKAGSDDEAFSAWCQAITAEAGLGAEVSIDALERAASRTTAWERAVEALRESLSALPGESSDAQIAIHRALGHIHRSRLKDFPTAVSHFRWVLQLDPSDASALEALEEIGYSTNGFELLEFVFKTRADVAADDVERLAPLRRLGQLYEDVLADGTNAARVYQEILDVAPDDDDAFDALVRVLELDETPADLATSLEGLLTRTEMPSRRRYVQHRLARLYLDELDQPESALDHVRAIVEGPVVKQSDGATDDDDLQRIVEELFEREQTRAGAAPLIETILRERRDLERLIEALDARLGATDDRGVRIRLLDELAMLHESVRDDPAAALNAQLERFRLTPANRDTLWELMRLAGITDGWEAVAETFQHQLELPTNDEFTETDAHGLRIVLADIYHRELIELDDAVAQLKIVVTESSDRKRLLTAYEALETLHKKSAELGLFVEAKLAAADLVETPAARQQKLMECAQVLAGPLERPDDAVAIYRRLREEYPEDWQVALKLAGLLIDQGRSDDAAAHFDEWIATTADPEREASVKLRRALFWRDDLGRWESALDELVGLIDTSAGLDAREGLIEMARAMESTPQQREFILDALEEYYSETDERDGRMAVLLVRADFEAEGPARAAVLRQAAEVWLPSVEAAGESPDDAQQAFDLYTQALAEAPSDTKSLTAMENITVHSEDWRGLHDALVICGEHTLEPNDAVELFSRAARLAGGKLNAPRLAVETWQRVREAASTGEQRLGALHAMAEIHRQAGDIPRLIEAQEGIVVDTPAGPERGRVTSDLSRSLRTIGRLDDAIEQGQLALSDLHGGTDASRELRARVVDDLSIWMESAGRDEDFVIALLAAADAAAGTEDEQLLLHRAARVASERIQDPQTIITAYEALLAQAPHDEVALQQLASLYAQTERWADRAMIIDVQRELAEEHGDAEAQAALLLEVAELRANRLGAHVEALDDYRACLALAPDTAEALLAVRAYCDDPAHEADARLILAGALRRTKDHKQLAEVLEAQLTKKDPGIVGAEVHDELATLYAGPVNDSKRAWGHSTAAYALAPMGEEGARLRDRVVTLGGHSSKKLNQVLASVAAGVAEADRHAHLRADLDALDRAEADDTAVMAAIGRLIQHGDVEGLDSEVDRLEVFAREVSDEPTLMLALSARLEQRRGDITAVRAELGELLGRHPDRKAEAVGLYRATLDDEPDNDNAFNELRRLYRDLDRFNDLDQLLDQQLKREPSGPAALDNRRELAGIRWNRLANAESALAIYTEILAVEPEDNATIAAVEAMWGEGVQRQRIYRLLEPVYAARQDWDKLIALYTGALDDDSLVIESLEKMSKLELTQLDRPEAAFATLKLLADRVDEPDTHFDALEELAERLDSWSDLAETLERRIAQGRGDTATIMRLCRILETRTGDRERALHFYRFALEREPQHAQLQNEVDRLLRSSGGWDELVTHKIASAEASEDPRERRTLVVDAAHILGRELDRTSEAVELVETLLGDDPSDSLANETLVELFNHANDHESLHTHYRRWIEHAPTDAEAVEIQVALARSLNRFPETVREGLTELSDVLTSEPRHAAALDALDAMLVRAEGADAASHELDDRLALATADAADILSESYGDTIPLGMRARVISARLRVLPLGEERVATLTELGELLASTGRPEEAFVRYAEALRDDIGSTGLENAVEGLAAEHSLWPMLVELYEHCAAVSTDNNAQHRFYLKIGNILHDQLSQPAEAAVWYEKLVAELPGNRDALEPLARHYLASRDAANETRIIEKWLEHAASATELPKLRMRLAALKMDELGDLDGALAALESLLPEGASDTDIVSRLERLYATTNRFESMVALYETALDQLSDGDTEGQKIALLAKLSQVYETRLDALDDAQMTAQRILEMSPSNRFALTTLDRVERKRGQWDAVDDILGLRLGVTTAKPARAKLMVERANLAADQRDQPVAAMEHASAADELIGPGPGPDELIKVFESLLRSETTRVEAARHLQRRYRARKAWPRLLNVLMIEQVATTDPEQQVALAVKAAELAEKRLDDPDVALRTVLSAMRQTPRSMRLRRMATDLASRRGDWVKLAKVGNDILIATDDGEVIRDVGMWLGPIQWKHRDDLEGAARTYERVLQTDPQNKDAAAALGQLYDKTGDWRGRRELLTSQLQLADDRDRPSIQLELADLLLEYESGLAALPHARDVLFAEPGNDEAVELLARMVEDPEAGEQATKILAPVLSGRASWHELVELHERRAELVEAAEDKSRHWALAARIYEERLDDPLTALDRYASGAYACPTNRDVLRAFERVGFATESWQRMVDVLGDVQATLPDAVQRREVLLHLAQIYETRLNLIDSAMEALEEVIEDAPDHRGALVGVRRMSLRQGQLARALEVTEQLVASEKSAERRSTLWQEVLVAAEAANQQKLVVRACEKILAEDPTDQQSAQRLIDLHTANQDYDKAVVVLSGLAEETDDRKRLAQLKLSLAILQDQHLNNMPAAIESYEEAWELDPDLEQPLRRLDMYYRTEGMWSNLTELTSARIGRMKPSDERTKVLLDLAEIYDVELKQVDDALRAYHMVLTDQPGHLNALDALVALYAKYKRFPALAETLEQKAEHAESDTKRHTSLVRSAAVYLDQLEDDRAAERLVRRVLDADDQHAEALLMMARIETGRDRPKAAVKLLNALLPNVEGRRKVRILQELMTLRQSLGDLDGALEAGLEAKALDPTNAAVARHLPALLERTGSWVELQASLERDYVEASTDDQRCAIALKLVKLFSEQTPDSSAAELWLKHAHEAAPDHPDVLRAEIDHALEREAWGDAAKHLERLNKHLSDQRQFDELPHRAHQLGDVYDQLGRPEDAKAAYETAREADGTYLPNLLALGRLLVRTEAWDEALKIYQTLLMQAGRLPEKTDKADVLASLARASIELGQKGRARQYVLRLERLDGKHAELAGIKLKLK